MKYPLRETQSPCDELHRSQENFFSQEQQITEERQPVFERLAFDELPSPKAQSSRLATEKKRKEQEQRVKLISQYAVTTVVAVVSTAVAVGALPLATQPTPALVCTLQSQNIGLKGFDGVLSLENYEEQALKASLTPSGGGDSVTQALEGEGTEREISFAGLLPETEYILRVIDGEGVEYYAHTFTTQPFITFTPVSEDKSAFVLHEEISLIGDVELALFDRQGKDFTSQLYVDLLAESYLYAAGLYAGEYVVTLTQYSVDGEPQVYEKVLTVDGLTPLIYDCERIDGELILTYRSGDIWNYQTPTVVLSNDTEYYSYADSEVRVDGDAFYVSLSADVAAGSYRVALWGSFEGDLSFDNEIWIGEIEI